MFLSLALNLEMNPSPSLPNLLMRLWHHLSRRRKRQFGLLLVLLLVGGVLYSTGVIFYVNKRLKFARAIWHGHVVAAAATHWTAVLVGVVLTSHV